MGSGKWQCGMGRRIQDVAKKRFALRGTGRYVLCTRYYVRLIPAVHCPPPTFHFAVPARYFVAVNPIA